MTIDEKMESIREFLKDSAEALNCPSVIVDTAHTRRIHLSMIEANEQLRKLRKGKYEDR